MKIKICGVRRSVDAEYLNEFMPDYAGFIFAKSKRQVSLETACRLREKLNPKISTVGVFVNADVDFIKEAVRKGAIDLIQLHGDEGEEYTARLEGVAPIIKAQRVSKKSDIRTSNADFYLFDTFVNGVYGGTGKSFDWSILDGVEKPYFLAGGINADNIASALKTSAYAIDVSGGVETDGVKDREKILRIIEKVRNNA